MKAKNLLVLAAAALSACAIFETEEPKPAPEPVAAPAPAPEAKPAETPPPRRQPVAPVAEKTRISAQVLFDFDRAALRPQGRSALDEFASRARGVDTDTVIVTGHADRIGSDSYNLALSQRRADAVREYLVAQGFASTRVYSEGKGEAQPLTGDACRKMGRENRRNLPLIACLQPDRRVELELIGTRKR